MKRIAVIAVALLVVAATAWWLTRAKPVAVTAVTVGRGPVSATVANTRAGTVDACRRARLSPALGGQIATLPVKNGDHVEKGTLLLELWNEDVKAQLALSERDALASRSLAREACVTADVAKRDAERLMRLHDQRLASEEAADQALGKAEANAAACTAAQDTARVADARVDVTRAQLDRTQLRAPFAGVIAEINGELGEFVTPSPVGIPTPPTVDLIDRRASTSARRSTRSTRRGFRRVSRRESASTRSRAHVPRPRAPRRALRRRPGEAGAHRRHRGGVRRRPSKRACSRATAPTSKSCSSSAPTCCACRAPWSCRTRRSACSIQRRRSSQSRPIETGIANWEFTEDPERPARRRSGRELGRPRRRARRRARRNRSERYAQADPMMQLRGICRDFQVGGEAVHALDHVDLAIQPGEYVSIMGPSGSGKSTLLNVLGLLDRPTSGTYRCTARTSRSWTTTRSPRSASSTSASCSSSSTSSRG